MKLIDILKKLGVNIEEEIEYTDEKTSEVEEGSNLNDSDVEDGKLSDEDDSKEKREDNKEDAKEYKEESTMEIKFDEKTGMFDTSNIEDSAVKDVLERANNYTIRTANNVKIEKAFNEKMSGLKIRKGITTEAVKKLINFDDIKVDGDSVIGLDEAFETLQKEQSGLFVQRNQSESNPMLEGFNPVNTSNDNGSVLNASLAALSASLSGNN